MRVGEDFDLVVLGVGLGEIPNVCQDIIVRDSRWRDMMEHLKTVETQAFQIWLREDMESLGWSEAPASLAAYVHPFETWGDMRDLIGEERWPEAPRAIAYFCSVSESSKMARDESGASYSARRREEVRNNAIKFLNNDVLHLWPQAARRPGEFRWDLLVDCRNVKPRCNARAASIRSIGRQTSIQVIATYCRFRVHRNTASLLWTIPTTI
ncbi:MAG: hypothetical protein ACREQN_15135 [Candidatus Binataceae bacterium]